MPHAIPRLERERFEMQEPDCPEAADAVGAVGTAPGTYTPPVAQQFPIRNLQ
jgi:hypothetical protein